MSNVPIVVSLWSEPDKNGFLCSGILLDEKHVLTVKHAFEGWPDKKSVYVRLLPRKDTSVPAKIIQRHDERDAALLEIDDFVEGIIRPRLMRGLGKSYNSKPAVLHVIDPLSKDPATPAAHSVGNYDATMGEFGLTPENALGHSGGVVEVDGEIIALLSRRAKTEPLCRAVAMHLLVPWIETVLGTKQGEPPPGDRPPPGPGYAKLVERVAERVREILRRPGVGALVQHWSDDPLKNFEKTAPASELDDLLNDLHRATKAVIREWQATPRVPAKDFKSDCQELLCELVRLAVNPDSDAETIARAEAAPAETFFVACQYSGSAIAIYCSLKDLHFQFIQPTRDLDVEADIALSLPPHGVGKDLRNDVLQTLWRRVMYGEEPPKQIDGAHYKQLVARIQRLEKRDNKRYLLTAQGPAEWCQVGPHCEIAKELRLGVVIRGDGENGHLLMDEYNLMDAIRDYLQLLESWEPFNAKRP